MITISDCSSGIKYLTESNLGLGKSGSVKSLLPNDNVVSNYIKRLPLLFIILNLRNGLFGL
jgi:hypothetical protein